MADRTSAIRDFIYLDVERLYSLYSQVFEGVAEQIERSYLDRTLSQDKQSSGTRGDTVETQVVEAAMRTESVVLLDHMYNRLEAELAEAITDVSKVTETDYREQLALGSLVKVSGSAEIEDYERLMLFMEKFNVIGQAIALCDMHSEETVQLAATLKAQLPTMSSGPEKDAVKEQVKILTDVKQLAKAKGLHQDEKLLDALKLFVQTFNAEGFDIVVRPSPSLGVAYRAVIDRRWLRVHPSLLRSLYGGFVESGWSMVGHISYLPGANAPSPEEETEPSAEIDSSSPSMRDPIRATVRASRVFETMYLESHCIVEPVLRPLAIYGEIPRSNGTAEKSGDMGE